MTVDKRQLIVASLHLKVGSWQMAVDRWQLTVNSWQLSVGCLVFARTAIHQSSWTHTRWMPLESWKLDSRESYSVDYLLWWNEPRLWPNDCLSSKGRRTAMYWSSVTDTRSMPFTFWKSYSSKPYSVIIISSFQLHFLFLYGDYFKPCACKWKKNAYWCVFEKPFNQMHGANPTIHLLRQET
jgi:hypothetical protein